MGSRSTARRASGVALGAAALLGGLAAGWLAAHRSSIAVRTWSPGAGSALPPAPLASRVHGDGETVVVLLSGLAASGLLWGSQFDALGRSATVVALDPLGFGASKGAPWGDGSVEDAHIASIDGTLAALGLSGRPTIAVGHSFGAQLALRWAARSTSVRGVVALSAPLFAHRREADERIDQMGWMESLLASGSLAERLCQWMCAHPRSAARAAVALSPRLPVPIAAASIQHSWSTYMANFDGIVRDAGWQPALAELHRRGVPVDFLYGRRDAVRVPGRLEALARRSPEVRLHLVPGGHQLPLVDAPACVAAIERMIAETADRPG